MSHSQSTTSTPSSLAREPAARSSFSGVWIPGDEYSFDPGPVVVALGARAVRGLVSAGNGCKLERRVVRAAEAALAERRFVTAIHVLVGGGLA